MGENKSHYSRLKSKTKKIKQKAAQILPQFCDLLIYVFIVGGGGGVAKWSLPPPHNAPSRWSCLQITNTDGHIWDCMNFYILTWLDKLIKQYMFQFQILQIFN